MAERPSPEKDEKGRFVTGNSGSGGRPKGSRNKLGEAFIDDLYGDWTEHGVAVIEQVRADKPDVYLKVVASILPRDLNVNLNKADEMTDEEILARLRELDAAIRPFLDAERASGTDGSPQETTRH